MLDTISILLAFAFCLAVIGGAVFLYKRKGIRINNIKLVVCAFKSPVLGRWRDTITGEEIEIKVLDPNLEGIYLLVGGGSAQGITVKDNIITAIGDNTNPFDDAVIGSLNGKQGNLSSLTLMSKLEKPHCIVCDMFHQGVYYKFSC